MKNSTQKELYIKHQVVDVAIVTVCRNGYKDTCRLIDSLQKYVKSVTYRIVVVDDCSVENEAKMLLKKYPNIKAIRTSESKGYASACNIGKNLVDSRYVLYIKNDTYVDDDILHPWLEAIAEAGTLVVSTPLILKATDERSIEFAGSSGLTKCLLSRKMYHVGKAVEDVELRTCSIPYLNNVAMMIHRDTFKEMGGPSKVYRDGYEDLDWSNLLVANGYKVLFVPSVRIYHGKMEEDCRSEQEAIYNKVLGRLLFIYRNRIGKTQSWAHIYTLCCVCPRLIRWRYFFSDWMTVYHAINTYYQMSEDDKMDSTHYRFSFFLPSR